MDETLRSIEDYFNREADKSVKASFGKEFAERLTDSEDEIFELISEKKDYLNINSFMV